MPVVSLPTGFPPIDPNQQAPGAWPKDTLIEKTEHKEGDMHLIGTRGRVVGSLHHPDIGFGYFVLFESKVGQPVFVTENRIRKVEATP